MFAISPKKSSRSYFEHDQMRKSLEKCVIFDISEENNGKGKGGIIPNIPATHQRRRPRQHRHLAQLHHQQVRPQDDARAELKGLFTGILYCTTTYLEDVVPPIREFRVLHVLPVFLSI